MATNCKKNLPVFSLLQADQYDMLKESVYYTSFNVDDSCMGYFNTFNCVNYLEHKIIFQTPGNLPEVC